MSNENKEYLGLFMLTVSAILYLSAEVRLTLDNRKEHKLGDQAQTETLTKQWLSSIKRQSFISYCWGLVVYGFWGGAWCAPRSSACGNFNRQCSFGGWDVGSPDDGGSKFIVCLRA